MLQKIRHFFQNKPSKISLAEALSGTNVTCSCCEKSFITFLPYGLVKRANALCPSCGSLERHRLHWHYMVHQLGILEHTNGMRLLHVAPEAIFYNKFKKLSSLEYVPCAKLGEGYNDVYPAGTLNIDITDINIEDSYFDAVYCSHVLEHILDDKRAMKEIFRVLKPSGWALLQVPLDKHREQTYEDSSITDPKEREQVFGQHDHVRIYGRDYGSRLEEAGFKVEVDQYTNRFSDGEIFKFGFMRGEDIYLCTKQ